MSAATSRLLRFLTSDRGDAFEVTGTPAGVQVTTPTWEPGSPGRGKGRNRKGSNAPTIDEAIVNLAEGYLDHVAVELQAVADSGVDPEERSPRDVGRLAELQARHDQLEALIADAKRPGQGSLR